MGTVQTTPNFGVSWFQSTTVYQASILADADMALALTLSSPKSAGAIQENAPMQTTETTTVVGGNSAPTQMVVVAWRTWESPLGFIDSASQSAPTTSSAIVHVKASAVAQPMCKSGVMMPFLTGEMARYVLLSRLFESLLTALQREVITEKEALAIRYAAENRTVTEDAKA